MMLCSARFTDGGKQIVQMSFPASGIFSGAVAASAGPAQNGLNASA